MGYPFISSAVVMPSTDTMFLRDVGNVKQPRHGWPHVSDLAIVVCACQWPTTTAPGRIAAEQDLPIGQAAVKITLEPGPPRNKTGRMRTTTLVPPLVCLSINYYKLSSMRLCSKSLTTCTRMYHVYCSEVIKKFGKMPCSVVHFCVDQLIAVCRCMSCARSV